MSAWPNVRLGDVVSIDRNGLDMADVAAETRYLGLEHIARGGQILGYSTIHESGVKSTKFAFDPSHVLYGKLRPNLGKISRPEFEGVCSTDILPLRPRPQLDRGYLFHFLSQRSMVRHAASRAGGANLPRLSPSELSSFGIPLPPIEEQRRIAGILDQADAIRAKRRQVLDHLDSLTQSIFHDMFGDLECTSRLGELADIQGGLQVSGKRAALPNEVKYLRVANVYRSRLDLTEVKTLRATTSEINRTRLRVGDLLFVEGHANPLEVGRSAIWRGGLENCVHQNHLIRARLDVGKVLPTFAALWLNSQMGADHFRRAAKTTSGLNTISASTVRSAPIPTPILESQRELVQRVSAVERVIATHNRSSNSVGQLFQSLQSRAFRGEL